MLAVILATITAIIHLILFVNDLGIPNERSVLNPAFALSGIIYLAGAGLMSWRPSKLLYYLGAIFTILVIIFYLPARLGLVAMPLWSSSGLSLPRPVFEVIGMTDKLIEVILVVDLLYLARAKNAS